MANLDLEPDDTCPAVDLLEALAAKIEDPRLALVKRLAQEDLPPIKVFDQTLDEEGRHAFDPPVSQCPAVVLMTSSAPPLTERGTEIWHYEIAVNFKMEVPQKDMRAPLRVFWDLIRTVLVGNKQAQIDHIGSIVGVADYRISDNILWPMSDATRRIARGAFTIQFRFADNVLSQG